LVIKVQEKKTQEKLLLGKTMCEASATQYENAKTLRTAVIEFAIANPQSEKWQSLLQQYVEADIEQQRNQNRIQEAKTMIDTIVPTLTKFMESDLFSKLMQCGLVDRLLQQAFVAKHLEIVPSFAQRLSTTIDKVCKTTYPETAETKSEQGSQSFIYSTHGTRGFVSRNIDSFTMDIHIIVTSPMQKALDKCPLIFNNIGIMSGITNAKIHLVRNYLLLKKGDIELIDEPDTAYQTMQTQVSPTCVSPNENRILTLMVTPQIDPNADDLPKLARVFIHPNYKLLELRIDSC